MVLITAFINLLLNIFIHLSYGQVHAMHCTGVSPACRNLKILISKDPVQYNTICIYYNSLELAGSNDSVSQIIGLMKCKKESVRFIFCTRCTLVHPTVATITG